MAGVGTIRQVESHPNLSFGRTAAISSTTSVMGHFELRSLTPEI